MVEEDLAAMAKKDLEVMKGEKTSLAVILTKVIKI